MNPVSVSYAAGTTGAQTPIAVDFRVSPFQIGYLVYFPSGTTGSLTLDHTLDRIDDPSVTPVWVASTAITTTTEGVMSMPVQAVRLNVTSITGSNPVQFKLVPAIQMSA